jgi:hypothetical protein
MLAQRVDRCSTIDGILSVTGASGCLRHYLLMSQTCSSSLEGGCRTAPTIVPQQQSLNARALPHALAQLQHSYVTTANRTCCYYFALAVLCCHLGRLPAPNTCNTCNRKCGTPQVHLTHYSPARAAAQPTHSNLHVKLTRLTAAQVPGFSTHGGVTCVLLLLGSCQLCP